MKKNFGLICVLIYLVVVLASCGSEPATENVQEEQKDVVAENQEANYADKVELDIIGTGAVTYDPNIPVNNGEDITISFWYDDPGPDGYQRYAKAIEAYQEIHPNVTFDVNKALGWGDYWAKLPVAVANGTGPDLMHFHLNWYTDFIPNLAEPYPEALTKELLEDFSGIEPMMYEGNAYTIPVGDSTGVMFYNKEMWAEAGLTEEDIPVTWNELRDVAKKLTKYDGDKIVVNGLDISDGYFLLALNYQKGSFVFKEDGKQSQMNNPGALEAAKMLQGFITEDKIFAPGSGATQERFGNQQSAMMYNWTWAGGWLEGNVGDTFEWGVFPTPIFEESHVVDRNNPEVSAVVNAKSDEKNKDVAMDFMRFYFASDEYLVELGNKTYTFPTKTSCQQAPSIQENPVVSCIGTYIDKTIWTGIWHSGVDPAVSQILGDELFIQGKDAETCLIKFDEITSAGAEEAEYETSERKSPLAQYLK